MVCGTYDRYAAGDTTNSRTHDFFDLFFLLSHDAKLLTDLPDWFSQRAYLVLWVNHHTLMHRYTK